MPIATKNNAIIVKDGAVAENCDCCGGWVCCRELPTTCGAADYIKSATAVVTAGDDYVRIQQSVDRGPDCLSRWSAKAVAITPSSHYAGTFQLTKFNESQWKYNYPPDAAGCIASLVLDTRNVTGVVGYSFAWRLDLFHRAYIWQKNSPTMPTDTKTLSDMPCSPAPKPTLMECYSTDVEWYDSVVYSTNKNSGSLPGFSFFPADAVAPACPLVQTRTYSGNLDSLQLLAINDSKSGSGTPIDTVSESGSLAYTIHLTIES